MSQRADQGGYGRRSSRDPNIRIGDTERNEVAEALSQHYSDGRLDATELKERLDKAMSAKTGADLSGLLSDLPPLGVPDIPAPHRSRRVGLWVALVAVLLLAVSWHPIPWFWVPRVPWLLVGLVALVLWRRSRHHAHARRVDVTS